MDHQEQQSQRQRTKEHEESEALKRPKRAEEVISFIDRAGVYDFFHNLSENKESVTFEQFKSFLIRINGIARGISINERGFDGSTVGLSGGILGEIVLPPKNDDKEDLLKLAFESAKDLTPEDNSYMLPAIINELHLFSDGNGRTSRTLHLLMTSSNKEAFGAEIRKALSVDGRYDSFDINPGLIIMK
jgi:hypothetical protein